MVEIPKALIRAIEGLMDERTFNACVRGCRRLCEVCQSSHDPKY